MSLYTVLSQRRAAGSHHIETEREPATELHEDEGGVNSVHHYLRPLYGQRGCTQQELWISEGELLYEELL